jgi:hypothetical protein
MWDCVTPSGEEVALRATSRGSRRVIPPAVGCGHESNTTCTMWKDLAGVVMQALQSVASAKCIRCGNRTESRSFWCITTGNSKGLRAIEPLLQVRGAFKSMALWGYVLRS